MSKPQPKRRCAYCSAWFVPVRHQKFCTAAHRIAAWLADHPRVKRTDLAAEQAALDHAQEDELATQQELSRSAQKLP